MQDLLLLTCRSICGKAKFTVIVIETLTNNQQISCHTESHVFRHIHTYVSVISPERAKNCFNNGMFVCHCQQEAFLSSFNAKSRLVPFNFKEPFYFM